MNTDFRVSTGWLDHPKTSRLIARCGRDGAFSLIALWSWTARVMPSGNLGSMTDVEIEEAARWPGPAGAFVAACYEVGWLDLRPDGIRIHGWKEHNGYASGAAIRMRSARDAANRRWQKAREAKELMRSHMPSSSSLPAPALSVTSSEQKETSTHSSAPSEADAVPVVPVGAARRRKRKVAETAIPVPDHLNGEPWGTPVALAALWNETGADECAMVCSLDPERQRKAARALTLYPDREWWEEAFRESRLSKLLRGLVKSPGHEHFRASFDWYLQGGQHDRILNAVKAWEGKYRDGQS